MRKIQAPYGEIMITLNAIDHVNMGVKDLDESQNFYRKVFGFERKEGGVRNGTPWAVIGVPGRAYLCIYERGEVEREETPLQINHFGFNVEDFEAAEAKLRALGVPVNYGGAVESGASRSLYIEDPNGYEIELSEKLGGGLD